VERMAPSSFETPKASDLGVVGGSAFGKCLCSKFGMTLRKEARNLIWKLAISEFQKLLWEF
jgi:hypothetical protein